MSPHEANLRNTESSPIQHANGGCSLSFIEFSGLYSMPRRSDES